MNKEVREIQDRQFDIENKICEVSFENQQSHENKEVILMLVPQIYKYLVGKQNNIRGFLNQMMEDQYKNKVVKLLQAYKINYK